MSESVTENQIECRVSAWFSRRMRILVLMFQGAALFFFYDGMIGYPKQNFNAELFAAFESGKAGAKTSLFSQADAFLFDKFSSDQKATLKSAFEAGKAGGTWSKFAATRHLAAGKPKKKSATEISAQITYAVVLQMGAAFVLLFYQSQKRKILACNDEEIIFPNGQRIDFQEVNSMDLTRWDRGIALLETNSGITAKIDDYKYDGAGKIVKRLREKRPDLEIISES